MVSSQNGYSANDRSQIVTYQIGSKAKVALRKGSPGWLLQHIGNWFDANIRDIDPGIVDDWGYAERAIRGGTELSNHASGTALDLNATQWPLGSDPTVYLTKPEIARLKDHLAVYEGAIRWGGDYTGRKDPMHFEVNKPEAFCDRIQAKLQSEPGYTPPSEEDDFMAALSDAQQLQMYEALMGFNGPDRNNFNYLDDRISALATPIAEIRANVIGNGPEGTNNFHWLAEQFAAAVATIPGAQLDQEALRAAIASSVTFTEEAIAKAVADEADRRARDGDPATGPVS